jgi:cell division septation protein DedD
MAKIIKRGPAVIVLLLHLLTGNVGSIWARSTDKITDDKTSGNKAADNRNKEDEKPGASANVAPTANAPSPAVENEIEQLREELRAQQALLQAQQAKIAQLEIQMHLGEAQPTVVASTRSSESVSVAGSASARAPAIASTGAQPGPVAIAQPNPPQSGGTQKPGERPPSPLSWRIGAAEFTPGGWADITGVFRSSDTGSGTGTSFGSIPFNNQLPQAALTEFRTTAQTSRLSMKVDANVTDSTAVTGYVESDFNGFQPPNAYTSTNSSSFRLRLAFADVRHGKWEVLGGQSWSLLTPNRVGLSPMPSDVFTGYRLDTNYFAGLAYSRQAGFRVVYHPTDWWAIGFSLENPQQYAPSSVVFPDGTFFSGQFDNGSGATNATGATSNPAVPNQHPDVIVKSAFDWKVGAHALHLETAGLLRTFKVFNNLVTPNATSAITEGSGSVNLNFEVLRNFHLVANTFYGAGNGRYIGALGPDAIVKADGTLSPIHSGSGVAGFEYQLTPRFEFDSYYSAAYFQRNFDLLSSSAVPAQTCDGVSGFTCLGFGFPGSANTNNKSFQEGTVGFTQTIWGSPNHGKLQFINQASWVERTTWSVPVGGPKNAHAFLEYIDLRYVLP